MTLTHQLTDYVNACFTGLWINTHEPDEAEKEIVQHARQHEWKVAVWDIASGLRLPTTQATATPEPGPGDPLAALRTLPALAAQLRPNPTDDQPEGDSEGTALLLLHNFHRFLSSPEVIQTTFKQLIAGKQQRTFIVVLAPVVQIPLELEKLFCVIEHQLPDRDQLLRIATELTSDHPEDLPKDDFLNRVLDAAAGLTRYEAEGAFALSLSRHNSIQPRCIWPTFAGAKQMTATCAVRNVGCAWLTTSANRC